MGGLPITAFTGPADISSPEATSVHLQLLLPGGYYTYSVYGVDHCVDHCETKAQLFLCDSDLRLVSIKLLYVFFILTKVVITTYV